jgi:hypothetical protein
LKYLDNGVIKVYMNKLNARKLENRDQVEVRVAPATWVLGMVLGSWREDGGKIIVPVQTEGHGFIEAVHTDLR